MIMVVMIMVMAVIVMLKMVTELMTVISHH